MKPGRDMKPDPPTPEHASGHKRRWRAAVAVLALVVLAESVVTLHPHFAIESVFGFYAGLGFVACVAMVLVARGLAKALARPEGFYGRSDD